MSSMIRSPVWFSGASSLLTGCVVFAVLVMLVLSWGIYQAQKPSDLSKAIFFDVPRGAGLDNIAQKLATNGAIQHALIFRLATVYKKQEKLLRYGTFEIPAQASILDIIDILTSNDSVLDRYQVHVMITPNGLQWRLFERVHGPAKRQLMAQSDGARPPALYGEWRGRDLVLFYTIAVAEGLSSWQIFTALQQPLDFLNNQSIKDTPLPLEGSLAPNTYAVDFGTDVGALLERMRTKQTAIVNAAWQNRAVDLPLHRKQDVLILASIIEREATLSIEYGLIASVFINRLQRGMRLQSDPTVIYGLTKGQGTLGRGLTKSELQKKTAYNTYVIDGLPPTPIANPGEQAIQAAVNAAKTDYLFFVANGQGGHNFSTTLQQHNANVRLWRAIEAKRKQAEKSPLKSNESHNSKNKP